MSTMTATLASFSLLGAGGEPGWAMLGWAALGQVSCLVIQRSPSLAVVLPFSTTGDKNEDCIVSTLWWNKHLHKDYLCVYWCSRELTSACPSATVALSCLKLQILKLHGLHLVSSGPRVGVQWHMWVLEDRLWLLWPWLAVTVCCSVSWVRGSWGALVGQGGWVDSDSDGGWRRYRGDGLAIRGGVGLVVREVVIRLWVVGRAGPVACWVFSMAVWAIMAPSLSSSFKSVHARVGWGWDLPVQLGLGVPAVALSSPGLGPRITTLRGDRL